VGFRRQARIVRWAALAALAVGLAGGFGSQAAGATAKVPGAPVWVVTY
jgi:hypothetical protein